MQYWANSSHHSSRITICLKKMDIKIFFQNILKYTNKRGEYFWKEF